MTMNRIKQTFCTLPLLFIFGATSIHSHAADEDSIKRGEALFNDLAGIGCKSCHGDFGEGDLGVGPYIRGATEGSIRAAITGIGAMVVIKNTIDEQGIVDVSAYVNSLGTTRIIRTLAKKGRFLPNTATVAANSNYQVVIQNASFQPKTFVSQDLGIADGMEVGARTTGSISWKSPEEGEFKIECSDCELEDQSFTLKIN